MHRLTLAAEVDTNQEKGNGRNMKKKTKDFTHS